MILIGLFLESVNMPSTAIRITDEENEIIEMRMKMRGETNKSQHIKRVYFSEAKDGDEQIGMMQKQIDSLVEAVEESHKLLRHLINQRKDDVDLKILSATFMMLYQSVDAPVKAEIDSYINYKGIVSVLTGKEKK